MANQNLNGDTSLVSPYAKNEDGGTNCFKCGLFLFGFFFFSFLQLYLVRTWYVYVSRSSADRYLGTSTRVPGKYPDFLKITFCRYVYVSRSSADLLNFSTVHLSKSTVHLSRTNLGTLHGLCCKKLLLDFQNVFDRDIKLNELYIPVENVLQKTF